MLHSKGDPGVQQRRIDQSGLGQYFERIDIVPVKSSKTLAGLVEYLGVPREHVLSVGNSIRSDVLPSLEAGVHSVWIPAYVWEYERAFDHVLDSRTTQLTEISQVVSLVKGVENAASA